jgi:hypothetical protein
VGRFAPQAVSAQAAAPSGGGKGAIVKVDQATLQQFLRSAGYRTRGAGKVSSEKAQSSDPNIRAFPHFSSSFTVKGVTYPFTMLGYPPKSGRQASFARSSFPCG